MRRGEPLGLVARDRVVAPHDHLRAQLAEQVREVVRERVVVVDQQDHPPRLRQVDRRLERRQLAQALLVLGAPGRCRRRSPRPPAAARRRRAGRPCGSRCTRPAARPAASRGRRPRTARGGSPRAREMICIARTFGAPETVPAGNVARSRSNGETPSAQLAGHLRDEVRDVREALRLEEALDLHRPGPADAREVVAAEVDEHHVLGPVLLGGEQPLGVAVARARRAGDRVHRRARPSALDERLRRRADERDAVELEQEEVRRRVDAAQRAVERERRRRRSAARPAARARSGTHRRRGCAPCNARRQRS